MSSSISPSSYSDHFPPPSSQKVDLHKAEKPWQPVRVAEKGDLSEEDKKTEELYRKFQGILNKLTPQKFQSLAEQALQLDIDSEERLRGVIDKIFTKVVLGDFHYFS